MKSLCRASLLAVLVSTGVVADGQVPPRLAPLQDNSPVSSQAVTTPSIEWQQPAGEIPSPYNGNRQLDAGWPEPCDECSSEMTDVFYDTDEQDAEENEIPEQRHSGGVRQLASAAETKEFEQDFAQQTLDEDWFLHPKFGNAALHLDVPYDADVTVQVTGQQSEPYEPIEPLPVMTVRSRGRYRHLVVRGLRTDQRQQVLVTAVLRRDDPESYYTRQPTKTVYLMAGDRRHLAFRGSEFPSSERSDTGHVHFVMGVPEESLLAPLVCGECNSLPVDDAAGGEASAVNARAAESQGVATPTLNPPVVAAPVADPPDEAVLDEEASDAEALDEAADMPIEDPADTSFESPADEAV